MLGNTESNNCLPPIIEIASPKDSPNNYFHHQHSTPSNDHGHYLWNKKSSNFSDTGTDIESDDIELPNFPISKQKTSSKKLHKQPNLEKHNTFRKMVRRGKVGVLPETPISNNHNLFHTQTSGSQNLAQHHNDELLNKFSKEELAEFHQLFSMFDTDGSGAIGSEELKEAILSIGLAASDVEIDTLIKEVMLCFAGMQKITVTFKVDEDGNGEIDFAEFCHCMKKSQSLAKSSNEEIIRQCFKIFDQVSSRMHKQTERI
jgi:Ca2+-binding EF-hand superfamily protein